MAYVIKYSDEENEYRYSLNIATDAKSNNKMVIFQKNPSVGSTKRSDPTIGKVAYWAEEKEFKEVIFLNLFAYRSSNPETLIGKKYEQIVGKRNNDIILNNLTKDATIILAWGSIDSLINDFYMRRVNELKSMLNNLKLYRVGRLAYQKFPRHGLTWNGKDRELLEFNWNEIKL